MYIEEIYSKTLNKRAYQEMKSFLVSSSLRRYNLPYHIFNFMQGSEQENIFSGLFQTFNMII